MQSRRYIQLLLVAGLLTACSAEAPKTAATQDEPVLDTAEKVEVVEYLFVQHSNSVTLEDGLLTFEGIGDDVLYFSDRPHRIVGRVPVEQFIGAWDKGEDSFATSPPNAVLTVKHEQELADLTLVLSNPVLTDRTLVYTVEVLDGPESGSGTLAALFIDAFLSEMKDRARGRLGRDISRGGGLGGRMRGGDRNLPRDPGGGRRGRDVHRGGSREGPEIR